MKAFVIGYGGGKDIVCHEDPAQALRWWIDWMASGLRNDLDKYLTEGLTVKEADPDEVIYLRTTLERPNDTRTIAQMLQETTEPGVIGTGLP